MRRKVLLLLAAVCLTVSGCGLKKEEWTASLEEIESLEKMESLEEIEILEDIGEAERLADMESIGFGQFEDAGFGDIQEESDNLGIDEIENNWPESIRYSADGVYANPMYVSFEIEEPVTLSVVCMTRDGKLRLKITDENRETVYLDQTNPDGTYTVEITSAGTYRMLLYARYHVGSVEIKPVEE